MSKKINIHLKISLLLFSMFWILLSCVSSSNNSYKFGDSFVLSNGTTINQEEAKKEVFHKYSKDIHNGFQFLNEEDFEVYLQFMIKSTEQYKILSENGVAQRNFSLIVPKSDYTILPFKQEDIKKMEQGDQIIFSKELFENEKDFPIRQIMQTTIGENYTLNIVILSKDENSTIKKINNHFKDVLTGITILSVIKESNTAYAFLSNAVILNPETCPLCGYYKGLEAEMLGDSEQAIKQYKNALSLYPDFYEAYIKIGNIYTQTKQFELAQDAFDAARKRYPYAIDPYVGIGFIEIELKNYDNAIETLEDAKKIDSLKEDHTIKIYNELAFAYIQKKAYKRARINFQLALDYSEDNSDRLLLITQIARAYVKEGNKNEAEKKYKEATILYDDIKDSLNEESKEFFNTQILGMRADIDSM